MILAYEAELLNSNIVMQSLLHSVTSSERQKLREQIEKNSELLCASTINRLTDAFC